MTLRKLKLKLKLKKERRKKFTQVFRKCQKKRFAMHVGLELRTQLERKDFDIRDQDKQPADKKSRWRNLLREGSVTGGMTAPFGIVFA